MQAKDLRIGNLLLWNPKLTNPENTLPSMQIEVFSILQDKIFYVFPNIENRVEPFEDDVAQLGAKYKPFNELEPILLTTEILEMADFKKKNGLFTSPYYGKGFLQFKPTDEFFRCVFTTNSNSLSLDLHVRHVHQLQNLFFALTAEELVIKLHGQQA